MGILNNVLLKIFSSYIPLFSSSFNKILFFSFSSFFVVKSKKYCVKLSIYISFLIKDSVLENIISKFVLKIFGLNFDIFFSSRIF